VQAILDARELADCLAARSEGDWVEGLTAYEARRLPATSNVVLASRTRPPDVILREVYLRTGDQPFQNIEDVISAEELAQISNAYKRVSGYSKQTRGIA
jgi:2-polyprenyl-6-methoxyphenol hydroxylase-like FAD-dependent oxidoreductase